MSLLTIEEREAQPAREGLPLFALGFRPFYLLAAAFAAASVPAWVATQLGWDSTLRIDLAWHMHEMVFGFVLAVVIGFLYTAGRNWTGLWTPRGAHLAALAGLWLAGRVAMLAPSPFLAAVVDGAFLPCAAWPLYQVLKRSGNRRNMFLVGLLGLLTLANLLFHASVLGLVRLDPLRPIHGAIMLIVVIEAVIGGRVIPMFTANAVPGARPVQHAERDRITLALTALAGMAWAFPFPAPLAAALAVAAAVAQLTRLAGWKPQRTLKQPLLWILHLSYAWIPLGFIALACAELGLAPLSAAVHLLAVGALAGLILGMVTRTALGHTGRALRAGRAETACYVLIQAGVLARFAAAIAPSWREPALVLAAACWSGAFALYFATYFPYLTAPRIDGREG
ncbi:MAG: NnrS family protein [Telluria sp.]